MISSQPVEDGCETGSGQSGVVVGDRIIDATQGQVTLRRCWSSLSAQMACIRRYVIRTLRLRGKFVRIPVGRNENGRPGSKSVCDAGWMTAHGGGGRSGRTGTGTGTGETISGFQRGGIGGFFLCWDLGLEVFPFLVPLLPAAKSHEEQSFRLDRDPGERQQLRSPGTP